MGSKWTKIFSSIAIIGAMLFTSVSFGILGAPKNAQANNPAATAAGLAIDAVVVGVQAAIAADSAAAGGSAGKAGEGTIRETADRIIRPAGAVVAREVLLNVLSYVANKLAYDAAVAISSGAAGQTPLIDSIPVEQYFLELGLDVAGHAIDQLGDATNEHLNMDFGLCVPQDPLKKLSLQIGLKQAYTKNDFEPRCDFQEYLNNIGSVIGRYTGQEGGTENILRRFAQMYNPGQSELSASISLNLQVHQEVQIKKELKTNERLSQNGFKNVTNVITGNIETPAKLLADQTEKALIWNPAESDMKKIDLIAQDEDAFAQIALSAASIFANTLATSLADSLFTGLFNTPVNNVDPFNPLISVTDGGRERAREAYRSILSPAILSFSDYNIMGEFVICPGDELRGLNNCVVDQLFASAVSRSNTGESLTVQEAVDEGFLHGDWPLIPSSDEGRNQDPRCHTYGYCYGNLVKIRKARIIPTGWEMAANSPFNDQASPATLQTVIDGFFDCNEYGQADASHPWCHLIDSNWVLKLPSSQCRAFVPSEMTVSGVINARQSVCVDSPSCISEDDEGQCVGGFGYCTQEKNVWKFKGDSCPAEYAGCLSFDNVRTGDDGNYLVNTINTDGCDSSNPGCMWYRTNKYFDDKDTPELDDDAFEFLPLGETYTVESEDAESLVYEDRIYVNQNVGTCSEESAGCRELINAAGVSLNMIKNPSFEYDENDDDIPDGWTVIGADAYDTTTGNSFDGSGVVTSSANLIMINQSNISLESNRFYTFSFYIKGDSTSATQVFVQLVDPENPTVPVNLTNTTTLGDCDAGGDTVGMILSAGDISDSYERFTCTFTTPSLDTRAVFSMNIPPAETYVDAVQLQLGSLASSFQEGYGSGSISRSYLKIAPDWLGCTGAASDPEECASYTQMCAAQDVGCALYTPTAGGFGVPAVISSADSCPSECVGYETYKQEATAYELEEFPLHFIASSAQSCSQADVGCDAYTNLNSVELGGEGTEYYSSLKFCAQPDQDAGSTFYTWEGTEEEGYQLRTWQLLESDLSDSASTKYMEESDTVFIEGNIGQAPCQNPVVAADDSVVCQDSVREPRTPTEIDTFNSCNDHSDIFANPDCREFYDSDGNIHYRLMSTTAVIADECAPYRKNIAVEDSCTDSGGFWTVGGTCRYFVLASESTTCNSAAAGCRNYTGASGRNASTVFEDTVEDDTLDEYSGTNPSISISNESIAAGGHSIRVTGGYLNTLSLIEGDSAVDVDGVPGGQCAEDEICTLEDAGGSSCQVVGTEDDDTDGCGTLENQLVQGKTYVLEFWARGTGGFAVSLTEERGQGPIRYFSDDDNPLTPEPVYVSGDWQLYSLGPLDTSQLDLAASNFDDTAILSFEFSPGSDLYIDNIILKETEENLALIKESWVTPSTCDLSPTGTPSPQHYLGCQEYEDSLSATHNLYQFTRLCNEDVIGCQTFYDTQNSESTFGEAFNATCTVSSLVTEAKPCQVSLETVCTIVAGEDSCNFNFDGTLPNPLPSNVLLGPETRIVPNDTDIFLVDDGTTGCSVAVAGCTEVGTPEFNQDKTLVTGFETSYIIDDPDQYDSILCDTDGLFCEAWSTNEDGTFYFKDPQGQTCESKSSVTINNQNYSGWFRSGTNEPCYYVDDNENGTFDASNSVEFDSAYLISGTTFGVWRNGDADNYAGWVAECPGRYDRCSEFVDPMDTSDGLYPEGTPYVYIKNEKIEDSEQSSSQRCNGQASLSEGCALFFDSIQPELKWNASASYMASEHADVLFGDAPQSLQSPISCDGATLANDVGQIITEFGAGITLNLCQQRCSYVVEDGATIEHPYLEESNITSGKFYTTSCVEDSDCATLTDSNLESVPGECVQSFDETPEGIQPPYDSDMTGANPVILDFNDVNDVRSVHRDRECSEWIACSSTIQVWDSNIGRYKTVCDQIGACVEYSQNGDSTICSTFSDDPAQTFSSDQYVGRDVSWWGSEYSGYSIPGSIQTHFLDQVNINPPKWCAIPGPQPDLEDRVQCTDNDDCSFLPCVTTPVDYRLAFNSGTCNSSVLGIGDSCYVGRCSETGYACSQDGECNVDEGETCLIGTCESTQKNVTCTEDNDCPDFPFADYSCVNNRCKSTGGSCGPLTEVSDCDIDTSVVDNQCVIEDASFRGGCYNNKCLLGSDGLAFSSTLAQNNQNAMECRGYPEQNSPYPHTLYGESTGLVTNWVSPEGQIEPAPPEGSEGDDWVPYTKIPGFQGIEICAPGEDCMCTYKKVGYGDGIEYRYYDEDSSDFLSGVCFGGDYEGRECQNDNQCNCPDPDASDCGDSVSNVSTGRCIKPSSIETMLGLPGYCLERDTSINKFNNSNNSFGGECLTWLPIDQLTGSDDIYNQFTDAGALLEENVMYCTETALFADLYVTGSLAMNDVSNTIANGCAESKSEGGSCQSTDSGNNCVDNAHCPYGYFAIVGGCDIEIPPSHGDANNCVTGSNNETGSDDDCPYFCVPKEAIDYNDGTSDQCVHPTPSETVPGGEDSTPPPGWPTDTYMVTNFVNALDRYKYCYRPGARVGINENGDYQRLTVLANGDPADGFWQGNSDIPYLGCDEFAYVGSPEAEGNKAWTNRVWEESAFVLQDPALFSYEPMTEPISPFGRIDPAYLESESESESIIAWSGAGDDDRPIVIDTCLESINPTEDSYSPSPVDGVCAATPAYAGQARSYEDITATIPVLSGFGECSNSADCNGDVNCSGVWDPANETACFKLCDPATEDAGYGEEAPVVGCYYNADGNDEDDENPNANAGLGDCVTLLSTNTKIELSSSDLSTTYVCEEPVSLDGCGIDDFNMGVPASVSGNMSYLGRTFRSYCEGSDYYDDNEAKVFCSNDRMCYSHICVGTAGQKQCIPDGDEFTVLSTFTTETSPEDDSVDAMEAVRQIFAKVIGFFEFDSEARLYNSVESSIDADISENPESYLYPLDDPASAGEAPVVYALGDCFSTGCQEGTNNAITVNGVDAGVVTGNNGSAHVAVQFFAAANANQMPIRNVRVDWGDGTLQSGSSGDSNYYKNHRGLVDGEQTESICDEGDEWGKTIDSCDPNYFTFTHDYTCTHADVATLIPCGSSDDSDGCVQGGACKYVPRVYVKDNWGYCAGECGDSDGPAGIQCYDDFDGDTEKNECDEENCDLYASDGVCLAGFGQSNVIDPWVSFDGYVSIEP